MMTLRHSQQGLTLLELSVASAIGLILLAGISQIFVSGKASYLLQERLSSLQESGRFALHFMQRDLRMAGHPRNNPPPTGAFLPAQTRDGGATNPDRFTVSFRGVGAPARDCLGNAAPGGIVTNQYCITTSAAPNVCVTAMNTNPAVVSRLSCNGQPMVDGVENLQILYGVDDQAGTENEQDPLHGYADRYLTADLVTNWAAVVSVRIAALVSSVEAMQDERGDTTARPYVMLDSVVSLQPRGVRRQVFTTTVQIRNGSSTP